jgi:1-acyl-sn-glycerol-3-phosphate acyltransferase
LISALRSTIALLSIALLTPLAALFGFPWTWITGNADRLYAAAMWIAGIGLRLAGVRVQIEGRERLDPAQNYIFMCNHVSNLDPPVLIRAIPGRSSVLVKRELFRVPILGSAMRIGDMVPVDRQNRQAAIDSMREAGKVMGKGLNMMVFPEGTRSSDGRLLPFKKGPFYLATDYSFPIVPATISGSERLMPKGNILIHSGTVRLVFHRPLWPSQFSDREELIAAVHRQIASALPLALREANTNPTP